MTSIPAGTPYMPNPEVTTSPVGELGLCPACGHATLLTLQSTVLHDDGVVQLPTETVCLSDNCSPDE